MVGKPARRGVTAERSGLGDRLGFLTLARQRVYHPGTRGGRSNAGYKSPCDGTGKREWPQSMGSQPGAARDRTARGVILDANRSIISPEVINRESQRCAFDHPYGKPIEIAGIVDRSVVEVFAK